MKLADVSRLAAQLDGVTERRREGLLDWRYRGRLVAPQLDDSHIVIRLSFDFRGFLLSRSRRRFREPPILARTIATDVWECAASLPAGPP